MIRNRFLEYFSYFYLMNLKLYFLLFGALTILNICGFSQRKILDPKYIEGVKYSFSLHPYYLNQSTMLTLSDKDGDFDPVVYRPNILGGITLAAQYRFISLAYTFPIKQSESNKENFGETDFVNINMGIQSRSFGFKIFFQKYDGYYQDPENSFYPSYDATVPHPLREDVSTFTFGFYNHFIFSRSFSMKPPLNLVSFKKEVEARQCYLLQSALLR